MSWLSKALKKIERKISDVIPHTHSADRRQQMEMAAEQLSLYRQQRQEAEKLLSEMKDEKDREARRLDQRRIRALRGGGTRSGFLEAPTSELSRTLGG